MSDLRQVKEEIANAIASSGWYVYKYTPETFNKFPCAVLQTVSIEYMNAYSGIKTSSLLLAIEVYTATNNFAESQSYIDAAVSYGTDHSIPDALTSGTYSVVKAAAVLGVDEFDSEQVNETQTVFKARINVQISI